MHNHWCWYFYSGNQQWAISKEWGVVKPQDSPYTLTAPNGEAYLVFYFEFSTIERAEKAAKDRENTLYPGEGDQQTIRLL